MKSLFISEATHSVAEKPSFTAILQCLPVSVGGILALVTTKGKEKKPLSKHICLSYSPLLPKISSVSLVTRCSCSELVHLQVL